MGHCLEPLSWWQRLVALVLCTITLVGCTVGPDFVKPDNMPDSAIQGSRRNVPGTIAVTEAAIPAQWWTLFNDNVLAELERDAQSGNLDLQMAFERIEQSRARLGIASSQLSPQFAAGAGYTREALSEHGKFAALGAPTAPHDYWQLGADVSWEIDLWGRARRLREGATAMLEASVYDREATRVALSAEVAATYLKLRGTQAQLDITQQSLVTTVRILGLIRSRERYGVATHFETSTAQARLAVVKAQVPTLIQRRNALVNALALLLGKEPHALDAKLRKAVPLPSLPSNVPGGMPSELARRRPDIRRAEARLHAATAAIGVATADFYPRIGLRGRLGVEAFDSGDLDSWDSRTFSVGPTVYLPIFQGGRLKRRLELTEARQKSAALAYRQTVLRAWHEVDNALDAWIGRQRRHNALQASYEQNKRALHAAEQSYRLGADDHLSVLASQRDVLTSQTSLNASATGAALALVDLCKALGGGWTPDVFDAPDESVHKAPGWKPSHGH